MWRKSKIWTSRGFWVLLAVELFLAAVGIAGLFKGGQKAASLEGSVVSLNAGALSEDGYYIDGQSGFAGTYLEAGGISLKPGVYDLVLEYESQDNGVNSFGVRDDTVAFRGLRSNDVSLYYGEHQSTCRFYLMENTKELRVAVDYNGTGSLSVRSFAIYTTAAGSRIFLFWVVLLSILADSLVMVYQYQKNRNETEEDLLSAGRRLVLAGIPVIAVLASLPVLVDYMIFGADLSFHLLRIEALADALSRGIFPARVEPMWLYGHGYANSLFYCDTFLLLPALLRLIGFSVQTSYHLFVAAVNLATAWIAYVSFKGCFQRSQGEKTARLVGLLGSMLYTLAPYRIYNIYNRGAVGEYTAMMFLPLLCYGFYMIFTEDVKSREYKRYWLIPVLGFSGVIQCHILSCEIVGFFTVLMCLVLIRRVFRRETFLQLVKVVAGTVLLNLWFLLPCLDMMVSGTYNFSRTGEPVQRRGIFPAQIFYTLQRAGSSSRFHETGMMDTEPIGVGMAVLLGIAAYLILRYGFLKKKEEKGAGATALFLGIAALVMSTCYFPWDWLQSLNRITASLVSSLQFPTRLTVVATICLVFVCCIAAVWVLKDMGKGVRAGFFLVLCGTCVMFSLFQTGDTLLSKSSAVRLYIGANLGHSAVAGGEYLPLQTDYTSFLYHGPLPSEGVEVRNYLKEGLDVKMDVLVSGSGQEACVQLPMLYYKGYSAKDMGTGETFETFADADGDVMVKLSDGYEGTLRVWYAGMWYWRAAEAVSALTALGIILWLIIRKRKA